MTLHLLTRSHPLSLEGGERQSETVPISARALRLAKARLTAREGHRDISGVYRNIPASSSQALAVVVIKGRFGSPDWTRTPDPVVNNHDVERRLVESFSAL